MKNLKIIKHSFKNFEVAQLIPSVLCFALSYRLFNAEHTSLF